MLTMGWCTVGPRKKLRRSRPNFKRGWRNANLKCIPPKPGSSIARLRAVVERTRMSSSTFLDIAFGPVESCARQTAKWSEGSRRRSALRHWRPCAIRDLNIRRQTQRKLGDVAQMLNPLLRGWIEYYGRYTPSALYPLFRYVNVTLLAWAQRKFKRFKAHKVRARVFLWKLAQTRADLFVHWQRGMIGGFA